MVNPVRDSFCRCVLTRDMLLSDTCVIHVFASAGYWKERDRFCDLDQILYMLFWNGDSDIPRATAVRCSRTESDCVRYLGDMRKSIGIVLRRCGLISEREGCKMLLERFF